MDMQNPESNELSERELDILKLVATGASNKEIALKLFISSNTVKVHLRNIFSKIGVTSRTEAAMYAVRTGLVVHAQVQDQNEVTDLISSTQTGTQLQTSPDSILGETVLPSTKRSYRWAPYILLVGLLGLALLGIRLSPSLALFSSPTQTLVIAPQDTPTPLPRWINLAPMPNARSDPAVIAYGDQIYAVGGLTSQGAYAGLDRYDPLSNSWTSLSPIPTPVYNAQAAIINGLIYVPGGRTSTDYSQPTDVLAIYDTNTGLWKTGAALPVALSGYGLTAYDGELYLFGGWDGEVYRNTVYSYNPADNSWQERSPMLTARGFCGVVEAGGRIFVIGGINENQVLDVNEIYSPARDTETNNPWTEGFPIPESRQGIRAVNIADTIYVFGGEAQNSNRVGLIYFPQTNVWQSLETSPFPLGLDFGLTAIGTNLFFIGGKIDNTISAQTISYQAIITLSIPIIIK